MPRHRPPLDQRTARRHTQVVVSVLLRDRDLLFVHVPKTAGGSISQALIRERDAVVHGVRDMTVAVPCVEQLQQQLGAPLSSFRTVACVRDPWDWTVSGWLHVTRNRPAYSKPPAFQDFVLGHGEGPTIRQYPHKFNNASAYVAYHTKLTQWDHLCFDGQYAEIDAVCRFESLADDLNDVLGLEIDLPHVNQSERKPYREYYNDTTRQIVADRNRELIKRFGYEFDSNSPLARTFY